MPNSKAYLKPPWFVVHIVNPIARLTGIGGSQTLTVTRSSNHLPQRIPVVVPEVAETTALGAAYLAGVATGTWSLAQVAERWREAARYEPRMAAAERERLLGEWRRALERSRGWADPRLAGSERPE